MSRALINPPMASQTIPPTALGHSSSAVAESHNLDVIHLLKRKFFFILFFVVLGLALSLLYFFKVPKTFESTAKIFVDEKSAPSANSNDHDFDYESPVEKYIEVVKSAKILRPAIETGNFGQMTTFRDCDDILGSLLEGKFEVAPADSEAVSGVMKLSVQGATESECQAILKHIVDSFDEYIESTTKNLGGETAQLVERMQEQMTGRLQIINSEIQKLVNRPELLNIDGHWVNPYHTQQVKMQEDLHELMREKTNLRARVKNIRQARDQGKDEHAMVVDILQEFNENTLGSYVSTHNQFVELKITEQQMLNQFGDQHPDLIAIRRQIEMLDKLRKEELSSLQRGQGGGGEGSKNIIDVFLEIMDGKIEMLILQEESLSEELIRVQTKSQQLSADVENLKSLQRERDQLESGYAAIVERLSEIKAYETHLWRNMTELDPPTYGEQVAPSLPISLAGGLLLGCLVGFLFAGFKEIAEKTFRSSDDISSILGAKVVGHIHQFQRSRVRKSPKYPDVAQEVVSLHQPAAMTSEAYRAIRTTMFFRAQETGAKVIQVTSPTPGDGKSTTISNLAASISQSGRRVLVIDADFRKPVQHKLFGLSNAIGMTSVIMGEVDPEEGVQQIDDFLHVLTCGPVPGNPAELLTSLRFSAIVQHFRGEYDYVLIDSPPVLAVTDPSIICGHADLVYMVMRIRNGCRTNSLQAKEVIDGIGADLGGIVVNGLRRRDQKAYQYGGQYGYGRYKYGKSAAIATANEAF